MKNGLVVDADGTQAWYLNNQLHRTDGPAWIGANGSQGWYVRGQLHRTDGPAIIGAYASHWWVHGVNITEQVKAWMRENEIALPFDQDTQIQFILTFGGA